MGEPAIPLILEELRREPDHWFSALEAITLENPVPKEALGKVDEIAQAWVECGPQKGVHILMDANSQIPQSHSGQFIERPVRKSKEYRDLRGMGCRGYPTLVAAGNLLATGELA